MIHKDLLYHKDQVDGQFVCQLCVRQRRRAQILRLAHESVVGGHLGNSGTRHVHANEMSNLKRSMSHVVYAVMMMCVLCASLIACVTQCFMIDITVINPRDNMFGNVLTLISVVSNCLLPSQQVEDNKIAHLRPDQRQQLCQLLDEFVEQYDDRRERCDAVVHQIQTTDQFVPRQMRPYRVPDAFKPDVDRQIQVLLDKGLIRPSDSSMARPVVCVAKKDGGVRIACDYRYLNSRTADPFDVKSASS